MTFKLHPKEKSFMIVTAGFFFLLGPFQTLGLLLTGWSIAPSWDYDSLETRYHILPRLQIIDNFVGGPALWLLTWVLFMAWRRGHIHTAVSDLALALHEGSRKKSVFDES